MLHRHDFPRIDSGEFDSLTLEWNEHDLARVLVAMPDGEWAVECVHVVDDGVSLWQVTDPDGLIVQTGVPSLEQNLIDVFTGALIL